MTSVSVEVSATFSGFVEQVIVRMGYLRPELELSYDKDGSQIRACFDETISSGEDVAREIRFLLYREKIYQETLPIRMRLYGGD